MLHVIFRAAATLVCQNGFGVLLLHRLGFPLHLRKFGDAEDCLGGFGRTNVECFSLLVGHSIERGVLLDILSKQRHAASLKQHFGMVHKLDLLQQTLLHDTPMLLIRLVFLLKVLGVYHLQFLLTLPKIN